MSRKADWALRCAMIFSSVIGVHAQKVEPNSASVEEHLKNAKKIAGTMWAQEANFFCSTEDQVAAMHILPSATQNDPPETRRAEPAKVFDNLYFVGGNGCGRARSEGAARRDGDGDDQRNCGFCRVID